MGTLTTEQKLASAGLRIICIALTSDQYHNCIYRVFTSDGGIVEYVGYRAVPEWVKNWMGERNMWNYVLPSCMLISGKVVVSNE